MSDYRTLLTNRRSIRNFTDREVSTELVKEILDETILAPSASNGQPWKFIIVNGRETLKRLSDEGKRNLLIDIEADPKHPVSIYAEQLKNKEYNIFYNAPCLVIIAGKRGYGTLALDCGLAACYFMFAAAARGLGTCWIGLGTQLRDPETLSLLNLPEDHVIVAPIVLGYPAEIPEAWGRRDPEILAVVDG
ncbi:MAG: nitroreductase family protein [Deltaproteobacteria bacterium]|nr:nitroreductase family protein [Candidatus Zymogenaceae bacterium]